MMAVKISYEDLHIIQKCLVNSKDEFVDLLNNFLKIKKDDYYFYGREPDCVQILQITTRKLKWILNDEKINLKKHKSVHQNLNSVYLSAIGSFQKSVFLYGRMKNE